MLELLASLSEEERAQALQGIDKQRLLWDWKCNARPKQLRPPGAWRYWLVLAGRGFGKTRTGAETVRAWVDEGYSIIHLVAPTSADARDVMVRGESGLLSCFPDWQKPDYEPSKRLITFHTGAQAHIFSADEPERLRGPQCEAFWADEMCAWRYPQDAWDNLTFGFRLGSDPRAVITTTPKPIKQLKELMTHPSCVITRGSTYENRANLAPGFFEDVIRRYEGTRVGRQELNAEVLEDTPGALWRMALIDQNRTRDIPRDQFVRVVVAIDPAVTANEESNETGIIVAALLRNRHVLVLDDLSCKETPLGWAQIAVDAFKEWRADRVVAEVNQGGDLVEGNLRAVAPGVPFRAVRAKRGKMLRAEPIAALYERNMVHHVGAFPELETQMCAYVPGADSQASPDRMDALVWAITELVIEPEPVPNTFGLASRVTISRF